MSELNLSVMLATRNGAPTLARTLNGYVETRAPKSGWELIVVDNGSTDASASIVQSFQSRLPLRVVSEPRPGKNRALNAGLSFCQGQLVVLTDDDAIPDPDFLVAWERMVGGHPDIELFGGRIRPLFEAPSPRWLFTLKSDFALMFAARDLPEGAVEAGEFYGPNMAVRRRVFDAGHRFAEGIGPDGRDPDYPMGSEVEFCFRVARLGSRSWFTRGPLVDHIVRAGAWSQESWVRRAFRAGRGRAYIMRAHGTRVSRPSVSWRDWCALASPFTAQRYRGLRAAHLRRGFDQELARWESRPRFDSCGAEDEGKP